MLTGAGPGLAIAMTPMVVYCASVLNASGPEIAGSLCFIAAGLRLQRPGAGAGAWVALAAGGAALALSRSLGPVLLLALGGTLLLIGGRRPRMPAHAAGALAIAVLIVAFGLSAWWDIEKSPHGVEGGPSYADALKQTFHDLDDVARHAVGNFGALDTDAADLALPRLGRGGVGLLLLAAVLRQPGAQRAGLALCVVVAGGITIAVSVFQLRTGYGAQGRHVLPALVLPPLYAGESSAAAGSRGCRSPPACCGRSGRASRGSPTRAAPRSGPTARTGSSATRSGRRRSAGARGPCSPPPGSCSGSRAT